MDLTYKFSTKPQDELSRLYYYGYRYYQPIVGRWINRDPVRESGGINLFSINNNLISHRDINGLECWCSEDSNAIGAGWDATIDIVHRGDWVYYLPAK